MERVRAPWRGFLLWLLFVPAALPASLFSTSLSLITFGLGLFLLPYATLCMRRMTNVYRDRIGKWTGHHIERPYLPEPDTPDNTDSPVWMRRFARFIVEPATWRDWAFISIDPFVALFTAALPFVLILYGFWGWMLSLWAGDLITSHGGNEWYAFIHVTEGYADSPWSVAGTAVLGTVFAAIGFLIGPKMLDVYGNYAASLLGPTEKAKLALRVRHLAESRADAVDAS
ncbi:sensor domain-containing protein, partial [Actinomadura adrarensis]